MIGGGKGRVEEGQGQWKKVKVDGVLRGCPLRISSASAD